MTLTARRAQYSLMSRSVSLGKYLATARENAGLTLRELAHRVGLSAPFMCDVEHDRRRFPPSHWPSLVHAIPGVTMRKIAEASVSSGFVRIDASLLTPKQRRILVDEILGDLS